MERRTAGECIHGTLAREAHVEAPIIPMPEPPVKIERDEDEAWLEYKKEVAKDILVALVRGGWDESYAKRYSRIAVKFADALVDAFKEDE